MGPGGYVWWYVDALSDDGRHGLTIIAFIGSVFSPYYAWARWADPLNHCAINVALYGDAGKRWAMTERRRNVLRRDPHSLEIGPSSLVWNQDALTINLDEVTAPLPSRIRGTVRLRPTGLVGRGFDLDARGRHFWRPIAPRAHVEVTLSHPTITWTGQGYFDSNAGAEPLENGFRAWDWSRAHRRRDTLMFYDAARRGGDRAQLALRVDAAGDIRPIEPPPPVPLPRTRWLMPRTTRGTPADGIMVRRTLEDTPFYSRSMLAGSYDGEPPEIVHESLSLDRLRSPIVRAMLPFRMPRTLR